MLFVLGCFFPQEARTRDLIRPDENKLIYTRTSRWSLDVFYFAGHHVVVEVIWSGIFGQLPAEVNM
ncbi:unnamed protein product [Timema podura]|uniref:Uncharacterized protein n=1 Tax=Timema podura TaxID=61482 RepID=A0ABN7NZN9_TIMPD|nr:unnamed protein product [Timema podura]